VGGTEGEKRLEIAYEMLSRLEQLQDVARQGSRTESTPRRRDSIPFHMQFIALQRPIGFAPSVL
jgi:hypothetical protein